MDLLYWPPFCQELLSLADPSCFSMWAGVPHAGDPRLFLSVLEWKIAPLFASVIVWIGVIIRTNTSKLVFSSLEHLSSNGFVPATVLHMVSGIDLRALKLYFVSCGHDLRSQQCDIWDIICESFGDIRLWAFWRSHVQVFGCACRLFLRVHHIVV